MSIERVFWRRLGWHPHRKNLELGHSFSVRSDFGMLNIKLFLRFSAGYFLFGGVVLLVFQDGGIATLLGALQGAPALLFFIWTIAGYVAGFLALAALVAGPRVLVARMPALMLTLAAVLFLNIGFLMVKTSLPSIAPYFADPFFETKKVVHIPIKVRL